MQSSMFHVFIWFWSWWDGYLSNRWQHFLFALLAAMLFLETCEWIHVGLKLHILECFTRVLSGFSLNLRAFIFLKRLFCIQWDPHSCFVIFKALFIAGSCSFLLGTQWHIFPNWDRFHTQFWMDFLRIQFQYFFL